METTALPTRPNPPTEEPTEPTDADARPDAASVGDLRNRLLRDAFLFEDPRGYRAGVEDIIAGFEALHLPADDLGRVVGESAPLSAGSSRSPKPHT